MSKADTIEDVLQHAVFMGTISDATFERLTTELEELRENAAETATLYLTRDERERAQEARNQAASDMLDAVVDAAAAAGKGGTGAYKINRIVGPGLFAAVSVPAELLFTELHDPKVWPVSDDLVFRTQADDVWMRATRHLRYAPRWTDERSQAQIAAYIANRLPACEERNIRNMRNWTEHHRDAWQLHHLGTSRVQPKDEGTN